ncbi:MAG: RsiV family protein [Planctomycetaceae bacterium]|nr:RsiV family protein [Planctomycetaceae bacterium]
MRYGWLIGAAVLLCAAMASTPAGEYGKAEVAIRVSATAEYPVFNVTRVDDDLQAFLGSHIEKTLAGWNGVAVHPDQPEGGVEIAVSNAVEPVGDRFVSVLFQTFAYAHMAAHPSTTITVLRYDMEEGRRLELEDCFSAPETALRLMAAAAPGLLEPELESLEKKMGYIPWFKEGFEPTRDNYAAFVLKPDGIEVVFQQYQILPYAFGMRKAFFPIQSLRSAGPNPDIWPTAK